MKNGKPIDWEERLARLEADVQEIKAMLQKKEQLQGWRSIVGAFANDPVFDEIRKITEEISEKERRKARRKPAKQKS